MDDLNLFLKKIENGEDTSAADINYDQCNSSNDYQQLSEGFSTIMHYGFGDAFKLNNSDSKNEK